MRKEAWIEKTENERIRIGLNEYNGREYVDIRLFYQDDAGEWRPTKKGVTLPPERLPELKAAIEQLQA